MLGGREGPRNRQREKQGGRGQIRAEVETQRESRKRTGLLNTGSNQALACPGQHHFSSAHTLSGCLGRPAQAPLLAVSVGSNDSNNLWWPLLRDLE